MLLKWQLVMLTCIPSAVMRDVTLPLVKFEFFIVKLPLVSISLSNVKSANDCSRISLLLFKASKDYSG